MILLMNLSAIWFLHFRQNYNQWQFALLNESLSYHCVSYCMMKVFCEIAEIVLQ